MLVIIVHKKESTPPRQSAPFLPIGSNDTVRAWKRPCNETTQLSSFGKKQKAKNRRGDVKTVHKSHCLDTGDEVSGSKTNGRTSMEQSQVLERSTDIDMPSSP